MAALPPNKPGSAQAKPAEPSSTSSETLVAHGGKWQNIPWNLHDFAGLYHVSKIKSDAPIGGTQTVIEQGRTTYQTDRKRELNDQLNNIQQKHSLNAKLRYRHAKAASTVMADTSIRDGLKRIEIEMDKMHELDPSKHAAAKVHEDNMFIDENADLFIKWCNQGHAFNVERMCKQGYDEMNVQLDDNMDTGLHIAARAGDVELVKVLLKYNANPNITNRFGDVPMHLVWRFWHIDHGMLRNGFDLRARNQCQQDEQRTTSILYELLRCGADPNARRLDKSAALHEAARRGPVQAVAALLQFKADHELGNAVGHFPLEIARAARHAEATRLIGSWSVLKTQFEETEFFGAWFDFCGDPKNKLVTGKTAENTLDELMLTEHQESIERLMKDGVDIEDEVLTEWLDATQTALRPPAHEWRKPHSPASQMKEAADRKRFIPNSRHDKALAVPIDRYLTGRADGGFREKSTLGLKGSFAYRKVAAREEANVRFVPPVPSVTGERPEEQVGETAATAAAAFASKGDKKQVTAEEETKGFDLDFFPAYPSSMRRLGRAASIVYDGSKETHVLRQSTRSKLHRTFEQTKPVRELSRHAAVDPRSSALAVEQLTEREKNEKSNPVMAKLKAMHHTKSDDLHHDAEARTNRRAVFNETEVLPRKLSMLEANSDHLGPRQRRQRRSRPIAGITRRVTADPWKYVDAQFRPQPI